MTEALFPPPRESRRRRPASLGWIGVLALAGATAVVPGILSGLERLIPLPVETPVRWAVGALLGLTVAVMIALMTGQGRRVHWFSLAGLAGWAAGLGIGLLTGAALAQSVAAGPPQDPWAVERQYWRTRFEPIEAYTAEFAQLYPYGAFQEVGAGRDFPQARSKLERARAALARARAAEEAGRNSSQGIGAQLARSGRDRFERRMLQGLFRSRAAQGDETLQRWLAQEAETLDAADRALDLLDSWNGRWRRDERGFIFSRPEDTGTFNRAIWRINVSQIRSSELRQELQTLASRRTVLPPRPAQGGR